MGVDPKTVRREHPPDNPEIRKEMNKIAEKRRRFGYPLAGNGLPANRDRRRIGVILERKGMLMNEKKLYRIYREEGVSVRRRRGRKRARGSRTLMPVPLRPNQRPLSVIAGNHLPGSGIVGFCVRHLWGLPKVPYSGRERRLLPRKPVPGSRHQHLRGEGHAGVGCTGPDLWKTGLHRQ